jgi:hypothetical protein
MKIRGCFVVWGLEVAPQVHTLTKERMAYMDDIERVATREKAIERVFGHGIDQRIPAWIDEVTELMATSYEGPHQIAIRGLCAAIRLGKPYGGTDHKDGSGGSPDRIKPRPKGPRGPAPVALGPNFAAPFASAG